MTQCLQNIPEASLRFMESNKTGRAALFCSRMCILAQWEFRAFKRGYRCALEFTSSFSCSLRTIWWQNRQRVSKMREKFSGQVEPAIPPYPIINRACIFQAALLEMTLQAGYLSQGEAVAENNHPKCQILWNPIQFSWWAAWAFLWHLPRGDQTEMECNE